jgi:ectoine hydroxylase-related dioxygenase (phytanoyl-CoA dioxygenase family)
VKVNPQQLLDDGYVVLRGVVPSNHLDPLRATFEDMVGRQRALWARDRQPDDPPGGVWEKSNQPRLIFNTLVDENTTGAVDFCLHEHTMGVSRQLMRAKEAAVTGFMFMCNPTTDRGPAPWHRDIHPIDQAPLTGLESDLLANAPGYVQWNIPLYDDDVLWVVPGSHRRINTDEENRLLRENPRQPLPDAIPVELKAGDGVAYTNTILHWGSNYSARLRRTIHLGYRSFGGPIFPYVNLQVSDRNFMRFLSPASRACFERFDRLHAEETDVIESLFRAVIRKDREGFLSDLAILHPGEKGRIVCVIQLSKIAYKIKFRTHATRPHYGGDISCDRQLAPRFTPEELDTLWTRFAYVDARIQSETEQYVPGFQSGPMSYYFNEMPEGLDIESFIKHW